MSGSESPDEPTARLFGEVQDEGVAKSATGSSAQPKTDVGDSQATVMDASAQPKTGAGDSQATVWDPPAQATQRFDQTNQPTQILASDNATELLGAQQPPVTLPPPVLAPPNPSTRSGAYRSARWFHGITAFVTWALLILQLGLAVEEGSTVGGLAPAIINYFSLFAVLASMVVALVVSALAMNPIRQTSSFAPMRLDSVLMITLSALIYSMVLAPKFDPQGWQAVANYGLHYVVPLLALVGYGVFGPRPRLSFRDIPPALLIPAIWVVFILLIGVLRDWYPYPFLDIGALGYDGVAVNLVWLTVAAVVLAVGFVLLDKKLPWAPRR